MLSPKASTRDAFSESPGCTVTVNEHEAVRLCASVVVHAMVLLPSGNDEPVCGTQPDVTGDVPPLNTGLG
jgi:hypothetical protein